MLRMAVKVFTALPEALKRLPVNPAPTSVLPGLAGGDGDEGKADAVHAAGSVFTEADS